MSDVIIIKHLPSGIDRTDDTSLPFRLRIALRPPAFMSVTFVMLYGGTEEIVARGPTRESLETFASENGLRDHPRLRSFEITETTP